jgi:hypothetical protein
LVSFLISSVFFVIFILIVAVHHSSASTHHIKKRYYDSWDWNGVANNNGNDYFFREKSYKKEDPCSNKPLWYLKYQARLGKLSPFYDCLNVYGL